MSQNSLKFTIQYTYCIEYIMLFRKKIFIQYNLFIFPYMSSQSINKYLHIFSTIMVILVSGNDILEDREVVCSSDRMVVNLSFRRPFNGLVFVQGQFQQEKCKWRGNGGHYLLVILPLRDSSFCGIRWNQTLGEHSTMLIVSTDAHILTQQSLALAVSCVHGRREQTLTLTIGAPSIDSGFRTMERESISSLLGKAPPIPALSLQIKDGHGLAGQPLNEAAIGQRLTLDAALSDNSVYDMFVHNCIAHDGAKNAEASILIIDENGCAIRLPRAVDGPAMVSPQIAENVASRRSGAEPKHVFVHFYGFHFTTGPVVHFECEQCNENAAIHGSTAARISSRTIKAQLHVRPQILQPIAITPMTRMERLVSEERPAFAINNCTDLAWLLILSTLAVLLCIAIWTLFVKLHKVITGIYKAIKA